ncbi:MAG: tyrosine-type recombinase/integrase [Candidatus Eremiobacteraeota bacterium]|nr:tyrosine-type recombinase/integrase [Candidatus Eremiobacteraeota bacterium]
MLVTTRHGRLPTRSLQDIMQRYRERADLDVHCSPHSLRHSFASRLAEQASLPVVQAVVHRWLSSTEIYTRTSRPPRRCGRRPAGRWAQAPAKTGSSCGSSQ